MGVLQNRQPIFKTCEAREVDEIQPNLKTPKEDYSREEINKLGSEGYVGSLKGDFADLSSEELAWEAEQVAKSHGIYLEFNRDKGGKEKDWMYMLRFAVPGGGPLGRDQWRIIDEASERYTADPEGAPSIRLTTRQAIQFHWVRKKTLPSLIQELAGARIYALNGCGDNVRNITACPFSRFSGVFDATAKALEFGRYFRLPLEPHFRIFGIDPSLERTPSSRFQYGSNLLNRKFKIAFSAVWRDAESGAYVGDNCVECRTNDIGVVPIVEQGKVERYQIYLGGGQGQRNGKPTLSVLGEAFGILSEENMVRGLDAIVSFHQDWGDRQNRHWARLKYVVRSMGIDRIREIIRERVGDIFDVPRDALDPGTRELHHGWAKQPSNGLWTYGMYIENGRIRDTLDCRLKKLIRHLMESYPVEATITANQDLLLSNLSDEMREPFSEDLRRFGYGQRNGEAYSPLRRSSVACVGLPTCRLSYSDSERFLPELIDELERRGWGHMRESIGLSGCERQCSRPGTKTIGWVGSGKGRYMLKLMGAEDARQQGHEISDSNDKIQLRFVPKDRVADVTEALFEIYRDHGAEDETMGYFHRRAGMGQILERLSLHPKAADLIK